ncbi:unnamed protein product [Haemonchus placei]|uniref:Nucleotid_trans domain-containing protein n=1 Tax=Haemonchus placei TaxID=6290 RepID=A0A0N4W8T2_HAEPC|nr:unnamed protein product [Haemonchus placei]
MVWDLKTQHSSHGSAKDLPDLVFTANAAIIRGKQVYLANFALQERKAEWKINDEWFRQNGFNTYFNEAIPHEAYLSTAGKMAFVGGEGYATAYKKGKLKLITGHQVAVYARQGEVNLLAESHWRWHEKKLMASRRNAA